MQRLLRAFMNGCPYNPYDESRSRRRNTAADAVPICRAYAQAGRPVQAVLF